MWRQWFWFEMWTVSPPPDRREKEETKVAKRGSESTKGKNEIGADAARLGKVMSDQSWSAGTQRQTRHGAEGVRCEWLRQNQQ